MHRLTVPLCGNHSHHLAGGCTCGTGKSVITLCHRQCGIHYCMSCHTSRTIRGGLFDNFSNIRRSTTCQGCTQITASQSLYRCRCGLYRLLVFASRSKTGGRHTVIVGPLCHILFRKRLSCCLKLCAGLIQCCRVPLRFL